MISRQAGMQARDFETLKIKEKEFEINKELN
jgi:hypothetical protein